jgi:hypothetical protein
VYLDPTTLTRDNKKKLTCDLIFVFSPMTALLIKHRITASHEDLSAFEELCKNLITRLLSITIKPEIRFFHSNNSKFLLLHRCVETVAKELPVAAECAKLFWSVDYNDDKSDKLGLMEKMSALSFKCSPPEERILGGSNFGGPMFKAV